MMLKCPKCGQPRASGANAQAVCASCGLVFAKWAQRVLGQERIPRSASGELESEAASDSPPLAAIFLPATERVDPIAFYGRCALYVAFLVWGIYFISLDLRSNEIGES
ncbi:MAG: hypothetical protein ACREUX_06185, partial [Burkholderiales bacterium]